MDATGLTRLVIVGNGMAPGRALDHLLALAPGRHAITIFNAEPRVNYDRIQLSPLLAGEKRFADIVIHDEDWYARHAITLHRGERVVAIDRAARTVTGANGTVAPYDTLILATGSSPVILPVPGHALPGVLTYRDLDDVEAMLAAARPGARAVVIGGGLLGLEAAAGLAARGMAVTVLHLMPHLMERQLDPAAGALLKAAVEARGIQVRCGADTAAITGVARVTGVRLSDGSQYPADIVVMAAGIRPNVALARAAGLVVNRGIVAGPDLRTSDPDICALGECAECAGQIFGLVAPLYDMAQVLARRLAGEARAVFSPTATATRLKVSGVDLYSAGDFAEGNDRQEIVLHDRARSVYKRLVLKGDRLIGAVLFGDTADGPWFFDRIRSGAAIAAGRDTLIFGRDFAPSPAGPELDLPAPGLLPALTGFPSTRALP